jgi:acetolactate synthase I/II/III large subunit
VLVAEAVGAELARLGVRQVFGVVGSGNFHVTNALVHGGARFVAARHEGGAATMADSYARLCGEVSALSVHQGCGLTNAMTGITEAAKSRTPMLVIAAEADQPKSNFYIDQAGLGTSVGARVMRVEAAETAVATAATAYHVARTERRTVLLNLPLAVQAEPASASRRLPPPAQPGPSAPDEPALERLVTAIVESERPVFVAGRGARAAAARDALIELASRSGALLATSAAAKGLFHDQSWSLDVSGGFASPLAAELIRDADLVLGWGCALNMWTMRHGELIGPGARVGQIDLDEDAIGAHRSVDFGVVGDVAATAAAAAPLVAHRQGYRRDVVRARITGSVRWRDVPFDDTSTGARIDPRTLTIALDGLLPAERVVCIDSGNFMGYPSMFLSVPDERGFCFTQAFQSIGLGLASAIGAALAQPDRLPVACLGDGGALMSVAELETVVRLGLPMILIVYNDEAYGAEVHHFGPEGFALGTVRFPETDIASIARGFGFEGVTVRRHDDLSRVGDWLAGERRRPLLIDAKITDDDGSWWLKEAFRGH